MKHCHITPEMEQARAELARLADDLSFSMAFWNDRHCEHAAAVSRWHLLWRQGFGGDRTVDDPPIAADVISGGCFHISD